MASCDRCEGRKARGYQIEQRVGEQELNYYIGALCDKCRAEFTGHLLNSRHDYIHRYFVEASNKMFKRCIEEFMIPPTNPLDIV